MFDRVQTVQKVLMGWWKNPRMSGKDLVLPRTQETLSAFYTPRVLVFTRSFHSHFAQIVEAQSSVISDLCPQSTSLNTISTSFNKGGW